MLPHFLGIENHGEPSIAQCDMTPAYESAGYRTPTSLCFIKDKMGLSSFLLPVHKDDVENVIRLIYESVQTIQNGETFSYFDA